MTCFTSWMRALCLTPNFDRIYDGHVSSASEGTTLVKKYSDQDIVEYAFDKVIALF